MPSKEQLRLPVGGFFIFSTPQNSKEKFFIFK
ncbi:hypothetical protein X474_04830 [Dethiosulfatarculus sandiegensis]|uniref:Uncharacterized protein n=1 Tax=Dethiosulfatarculus sandiegensis TaxID=1429043 RepID=A0A0D2JAP8_9BACT|nr:hypothetical protein X474_04830 [Dethiosulfatarculus sandiegensis]